MTAQKISPASARARFQRIDARAPDADAAERALAEALGAGALGAEQCDEEQGVTLRLYAPAADAAAVARAAATVLGRDAVSAPAPVPDADWSEAWKEGLGPIEISPRLRVRPSFAGGAPRPGQRDLVIDPGQAFGTGSHESTRLALEGLDALHAELGPASRLLDVGVGSGVLALAACALGAGRVVAFDLDPLAAPAARDAARANGLSQGLALFTGPLAALGAGARFDGIVANLLSSEHAPIFEALVSRLETPGWLLISGLLEGEVATWRARGAGAGLATDAVRTARDASGAGWAALLMRRSPPRRGA